MAQQVKQLSTATESSFSDRKQRIYDFLHDQHAGVLSSVTPDNDPHGVVVYYELASDFKIRILTKTGTRKYENMIHNNHIMLTVFEPQTQATVQITGIAVERSGFSAVKQVAKHVFSSATSKGTVAGLSPVIKLQAGAFTTFEIQPVQIRMAVYARPDPSDYEQIFESIESFDYDAAQSRASNVATKR